MVRAVHGAWERVRDLAGNAGRWWAICRLVPLAGRGLALWSVLVNLAIGVLPLAFLVGTSVMVERVPGIVPASPGGRSHWAGALAALALSVSALVLQNLFSPAQAALGELVTRRVDGHVTRRLMRSALAEAPMEVLDSQDVLDKLSDARRGLQETWSTPGGAVAGLMALVARYTQLAGSVVIVAAVVGVGWGAVICSCAMVARFGNRGSLGLFSRVWSTWVHDKRRLDYVYESGTDVAMAKEMRVLGVLPWWKDRAGASAASFYERLWKERRHIYFAPFLVFTALVLAGTVATLLAVRAEAVGGHLDVLRFVLAVQAVLVPLRFGVFFPEADLQTQFGMSSWEVMAFFDRFLELTEGLTTVIISHRFSTVRRAQRIVVLEHGRVAEQGPHDELVSLGGRYAELFELQARRFAAGAEDSDEGDEGDRAGAETAGAAPGGLA